MSRMDCGEVRELLHVYEDDELPASVDTEVERHLGHCRDCRSALTALQSLRSRIRAAGTFSTPVGLDDRVRTSIGVAAQRRALPPRLSIATLAASHVLVAALGAVAAYVLQAHRDVRASLTRDVISAHVRSLIGEQIVQIASTETHTVKPWFAGRVSFAPDVVDLATQEFPLIGGRLDYVFERPVVAVVYGRRKHRINLFVLPERQAELGGAFETTRDGYNIVAWRQEGFAYVAASDLNAPELRVFAQAVRQAQTR